MKKMGHGSRKNIICVPFSVISGLLRFADDDSFIMLRASWAQVISWIELIDANKIIEQLIPREDRHGSGSWKPRDALWVADRLKFELA